MRFGVLGETAVWDGAGVPVRVPELKVRALLASLLAHAGRPVATARLIDDLWGDEPPGNPARALQAKVSQLRAALDSAEPGARELVVTRAPGYALTLTPGSLDAHRFTGLVARARTEPGTVRAGTLTEALALWRGPALADFADEPFARAAVTRLDEERLAAEELLAETRLELGDDTALLADLGELIARHPLRERLRAVQFRALYRVGRQGEALAGYEELRHRLSGELGLDPSPALAALHTAMLRQDPALDAPARPGTPPQGEPLPPAKAPAQSPTPPRTNLPAPPLTPLVGREEAVADLTRLLAERRLVTLTGPGGVGKTRLALAVVAALGGTYPDGEWLVELAGTDRGPAGAATLPETTTATAALAETTALALGLRDDGTWGQRPPGEPDPGAAGRLATALADRRLLLVLDNCEHVVDEAAALVERLLRAVPGLTVLTTSQEPLALAGETLWSVPPLAPAGALELFAARAAAAAPGFVLDDSNRAAAEAVCRRLDGIPLALELAATRVRALGVHRLLERLDDRFRLLTAGSRGAPARQQTLRAMIDWSWELLTDPERAVLRRLAAHAEGCTLEAAEAVCAGGEVAAEDVLGILARLIDRSLVTAAPDGSRYRLLESVAAYCLQRLDEAGERTSVQDRHLAHYRELAVAAEPRLRGPGQLPALHRLDADGANLRTALDTAVHRGSPDALLLVDALAWYWILRGRLGEGLRSATAALAGPGGDPVLRARVGVWRTGLTVLTGDGTDRAARIEAAVTTYQATYQTAYQTAYEAAHETAYGAADGLACEGAAVPGGGVPDGGSPDRARWFLGHALAGTGNIAEGEALTGRALAGFRRRGDLWGEAAALADRATQRLLQGALTDAGRDADRAAELFDRLGDACAGLWTVYPRASLAEIHGDYVGAAGLWRAGLEVARRFGTSPQAVDLLAGLGRAALLTGDLDASRTHHEQARRAAVEIGFRAGEINARLGLALTARRAGRLDEAETHLHAVLQWHRDVGLDGSNALIHAELGFVAELRGDAAGALDRQRQGYTTALTTGDPRALALALEGMAAAHTLTAAPDALRTAALLLGAADAARRSTGAPLPPAESGDADRATARIRAGLDTAAWERAFGRGGDLTPQQAVAEAADAGR
ncbi:BTAD domain-containing putative transcriptional regulator [Streptomyces sp. NPDC093252]|uniref:AfsR/SARP family transcriptional regulator n=1 Tax=Streptomyces sp. NPDC093252 TaxID=3154980 RepID=UPI00342627AD